jgi:hypothetical protein
MNNYFKIILLVLVLASLITTNLAYAQTQSGPTNEDDFRIVDCANGRDNCTIRDLIGIVIKFINFAIGIAWLVAVFFVFWGSYGLATSYGNSEKIAGAKKTIQQGIIGFFLIMASFILINWLLIALGGYSFEEMLEFLPL